MMVDQSDPSLGTTTAVERCNASCDMASARATEFCNPLTLVDASALPAEFSSMGSRYSQGLQCEWRISVSEGLGVDLSFALGAMHPGDTVEVYATNQAADSDSDSAEALVARLSAGSAEVRSKRESVIYRVLECKSSNARPAGYPSDGVPPASSYREAASLASY